jgi:hypothetical protein
VSLAIIACMDGCVMGQCDNLPIEASKFTLGIFNAKTRDRAERLCTNGVKKVMGIERVCYKAFRDSELER